MRVPSRRARVHAVLSGAHVRHVIRVRRSNDLVVLVSWFRARHIAEVATFSPQTALVRQLPVACTIVATWRISDLDAGSRVVAYVVACSLVLPAVRVRFAHWVVLVAVVKCVAVIERHVSPPVLRPERKLRRIVLECVICAPLTGA
jgi:hypothetical protein